MRYSGYNVVLDLDDCMASMREPLHHILNRMSGKNLHWTEWHQLHVESLYGITSDQFFNLAVESELLEIMKPHPEAAAFTHRLRAAGIKSTILTARGWHPLGESLTKHWLASYGFVYDTLEVCNVTCVKADYIRDMDKLLFTVDDSSRHCNQYITSDNKPEYVFAYMMPWTLGLNEGVIPINSLDEIGNHIEGL